MNKLRKVHRVYNKKRHSIDETKSIQLSQQLLKLNCARLLETSYPLFFFNGAQLFIRALLASRNDFQLINMNALDMNAAFSLLVCFNNYLELGHTNKSGTKCFLLFLSDGNTWKNTDINIRTFVYARNQCILFNK